MKPKPPLKIRRTTDLIKFAAQLDVKMRSLKADHSLVSMPRVFLIESPKAKGDITVVFEHPTWEGKKAIVYRSNDTWSGLSYWSECQI